MTNSTKETPREESSTEIVQDIADILKTSAENMRESAKNIDDIANTIRERWMMEQEQNYLDRPTV